MGEANSNKAQDPAGKREQIVEGMAKQTEPMSMRPMASICNGMAEKPCRCVAVRCCVLMPFLTVT